MQGGGWVREDFAEKGTVLKDQWNLSKWQVIAVDVSGNDVCKMTWTHEIASWVLATYSKAPCFTHDTPPQPSYSNPT